MPEPATVLIAARDAALADSIRFALELEGFSVRRLCSLSDISEGGGAPQGNCLIIDHELLAELPNSGEGSVLRKAGMPVVLLAGYHTQAIWDRAEAVGVSIIVEKPLLGDVLLDAIREAMHAKGSASGLRRTP